MLKRVWRWVKKNEALAWLVVFSVVLRITSWFEPYWYGDEGIYLVLGQALRRGLVFYRDIHDNKPPLLYLLAAVAGGDSGGILPVDGKAFSQKQVSLVFVDHNHDFGDDGHRGQHCQRGDIYDRADYARHANGLAANSRLRQGFGGQAKLALGGTFDGGGVFI